MKRKPILLYLCDRDKCGQQCTYPTCKHTHDVYHALHPITDRKHYKYDGGFFWEVDDADSYSR